MKIKKWTIKDLKKAAINSYSIRQVLKKLNLREAGGNYTIVQKNIAINHIDIRHFKGKGWRKGLHQPVKNAIPLDKILVRNSQFQSYKLKKRLFKESIKKSICEECGWAKQSVDGRIPLELHHVNGNGHDNRLENLKILCPNCHSLKTSHRGKNISKARVVKWYTRNT